MTLDNHIHLINILDVVVALFFYDVSSYFVSCLTRHFSCSKKGGAK